MSSDSVFFYVHSEVLNRGSANGFGGMLGDRPGSEVFGGRNGDSGAGVVNVPAESGNEANFNDGFFDFGVGAGVDGSLLSPHSAPTPPLSIAGSGSVSASSASSVHGGSVKGGRSASASVHRPSEGRKHSSSTAGRRHTTMERMSSTMTTSSAGSNAYNVPLPPSSTTSPISEIASPNFGVGSSGFAQTTT